jgi:hypothetical protein
MPMFQLGTMMPHKQREESIPSLQCRTVRKRPAAELSIYVSFARHGLLWQNCGNAED